MCFCTPQIRTSFCPNCNTAMFQRIMELTAERDHWKNNHETEVRRARILKERTDMPIERVQAYDKWGSDIARLAIERDALKDEVSKYKTLCDQLGGQLTIALAYELQKILEETRDSMQFVDDRLVTTDLSGVLRNTISKIDVVLKGETK